MLTLSHFLILIAISIFEDVSKKFPFAQMFADEKYKDGIVTAMKAACAKQKIVESPYVR